MNIPKLRFPEFKDEWEKKMLGEVATVFDGTHQTPDYVTEGIPFYSVEQVTANDFNKTKFVSKEVFGKENERVKIERGDILMTRIGDIGTARYINWDVNASFYVSIALIKQSLKYNSEYLSHFIGTQMFQKELWNRTIHVAFPKKINLGEISNCIASYPTLAEQQKIATFLTSVDKKLTQLKKKKSLLEQYKKGMMQKIFSQEIRFKDENGKGYQKWEIKRLCDVAVIYDGTHQTPDYQDKGVPFYSVEQVTSNNFTETKFISTEVFENENKRVKLEKGDILMTKIGDIGTPKYIDWDVNASFYVSLALIKPNLKVKGKFLCQFINTTFFQEELHKRTIHVAFPKKINLGEIGECSVMFPCLAEQTKIAHFLSAIDAKINHCSTQIEKMLHWKKGLLQKMFC